MAYAKLKDIDPELRDFALNVSEKYNSPITSGYRDRDHNHAVGGATNSQHVHGNAVDMSLKGLSEADKLALIDEVLANPKIGGVGYYDNDSIHFDIRQGGKAAWGQDRTASSLANAPAWYKTAVEAWKKKG